MDYLVTQTTQMNSESNNHLGEGTAIIVPKNGLKEKLDLAQNEKRPLVVKLGFDPTAPDLHLGHAVVLKKLRQFQEASHQVVVIIGDFTAQIGDPTGKNKARPPLEKQQVEENAKTYLAQLSKILDISKIQIKFNSEWFDQMHLVEMIRLISQLTLAQILERNDFRQRYDSRSPIALHEMMYPILQGYDSLMINADVEIGGTDQLFNIMIGRTIQETRRRIGQIALCMPLLRGRDGTEKMSKSQGNHIGLLEAPVDMYGKIMSIPDALLIEYLDLTTNFTPEEKEKLKQSLQGGENPMTIKKAIAFNVVEQYHNREASEEAERFFITQVQSRGLDSKEFQVISLDNLNIGSQDVSLVDLCHALEPKRSKSRIRDMIKNGAISVSSDKILNERHIFSTLQDKTRIKIGKRGYYEISVK